MSSTLRGQLPAIAPRLQAAVGPDSWEVILATFVVAALAFLSLQTVQLAYLPELSTDIVEVRARPSGLPLRPGRPPLGSSSSSSSSSS